MVFGFLTQLFSGRSQQGDFAKYPVYEGADLGLTYSPATSSFRIWAPTASQAELIFYREGLGGQPLQRIPMEKSSAGTWVARCKGDLKGRFYTFRVQVSGKWLQEVTDPYARSVGVNGQRAMVVDLAATDPAGWEKDRSPAFLHATDAIIYELHVRDASISPSSGIRHRGKFLGLTERGTRSPQGLTTGLDHLRELGVTHIHLLPCFDFNSVDERFADKPQYNWGYDPLNYNVPEGSYATQAADGVSRIREFKQLVMALHQSGLRVIMDVVYNHTALTENSLFNQLVPGYYYRQARDGGFSNATACGNELASERTMVRKFMLESVAYWVREYHVDGFRFDLMGVHDIGTMNRISRELHRIRPDLLLYGEGWTAGSSPVPDSLRALKKNVARLDRIAVFSDDIRDGIKGSVFDATDRGFASGKPGMEESIKFGITAACRHPQVQYARVNYSRSPYATQPSQVITYCECHDNHTLWDKLAVSFPTAAEPLRRDMHKLALSIVLSSQGIAFLHAGTEWLRSKGGVDNSFASPDSINALDWNLKAANRDVVEYVEALIHMRREHPAFRLQTGSQVAAGIRFLKGLPGGVVAYRLNGQAAKDRWKDILVLFNGTGQVQSVSTGGGTWTYYIGDNLLRAGEALKQPQLDLAPYSCSILYSR